MNILIVEDDSNVAVTLSQAAVSLDYQIAAMVDNAHDALDIVKEHSVDIALMDIGIKGSMDGILTATLLKEQYNIPSIFITSQQDSATIVNALSALPLGYLIKPVGSKNIEAALRVAEHQLRNEASFRPYKTYRIGPYLYDTKTLVLTKNDAPVFLSYNENRCLKYLLENLDAEVNSTELMMAIWEEEKSLSSLRELVCRLRRKLPELNIISVRKIGYILHGSIPWKYAVS